MNKRIVFIGAGAVGGYVGANMARAGVELTLVDPWVEHVRVMRDQGLQLVGLSKPECFTQVVNAITPEQLLEQSGTIDVAFIATKSYDTQWAARLIEPILAPDGVAVSLQNCINEPTIAAVVGQARTIGCIASSITVELVAAGQIQRNVPKRGNAHTVFRCGEMNGNESARTREIVQWLASVDSAKVTTNLTGERWTKLVINASRNGLLACSGIDSIIMETETQPRRLCIRLAAEAISVAKAEGITLESIGGFDAQTWLAAAAQDSTSLREIEAKMQGDAQGRRAGTQLSMGQDIAKWRRTEIDTLNGLVVELGRTHGIPTPANEGILNAVRRVESGQVRPSRDLISNL